VGKEAERLLSLFFPHETAKETAAATIERFMAVFMLVIS
jgi:hypothetical protein